MSSEIFLHLSKVRRRALVNFQSIFILVIERIALYIGMKLIES